MRRRLFTLLRVLATIALAYGVWRFAGGRRLLGGLVSVPLSSVVGLAALAPLFVATKIIRWRWLVRLHVPDYSLGGAAKSLLVGIAVGILTPARAGEAARLAFVKGGRLSVLAALLVADRICEVGGVGLWAVPGLLAAWRSLVWPLLAACLAAVMAVLIGSRFRQRMRNRLRGLHGLCRVPRAGEFALQGLGTALLAYALVIVQSAWFVRGYTASPLWAAVACSPLVALATAMPFTISGLGAREGVAAVTFGYFGVPPSVAVGLGLSLFAFNTLIPGVLGSLFHCALPGHAGAAPAPAPQRDEASP